MAEGAAVRELGRLLPSDPVPLADPLGALLVLAAEALAFKNAAAELAAGLGSLRTVDGGDVAPEVRLLERSLDRCEKVLSSVAKLGIEERLAVVSETQGRTLVAGLRSFLDALLVALRHELDVELTADRFEELSRPAMELVLRSLADPDERIHP